MSLQMRLCVPYDEEETKQSLGCVALSEGVSMLDLSFYRNLPAKRVLHATSFRWITMPVAPQNIAGRNRRVVKPDIDFSRRSLVRMRSIDPGKACPRKVSDKDQARYAPGRVLSGFSCWIRLGKSTPFRSAVTT